MKLNNIINFSFIYKLFSLLILSFTLILLLYIIDNSEIEKIKVGFYCHSLKYGGVERVTALLLNYLSKKNRFLFYLITDLGILEGEYFIPNNIRRISLSAQKFNIFSILETENIDILIYNFYNINDIKKLNALNKTKIIFYNHSSFFYWFYFYNHIYNFKSSIYNIYKKCKYVLSLIPLENNYLFKKWGINSILIDNPSSFEFDSINPSDLSNKDIIMIGRADDPIKRYELGIEAMQNIIKEVPKCNMNIVSKPIKTLVKLINDLKLGKYVRFTGFQQNVELFLKKSSLHIFPSLAESYGLVLSEAKIFGIPTIICGLDFLALSKGGTIIIYDDDPNSIAKESIKILKDDKFRKKMGKEARNSMKKRKNKLIVEKWVKILLSVYKGDNSSFKKLSEDEIMSEEEAEQILINQLKLLKRRKPEFYGFTLEKLKSYSIL